MFAFWCTVTILLAVASAPANGANVDLKAMEADWSSLYDHAAHVRWLVHNSDYAVATVHSAMEDGYPFGHVMSIGDGQNERSTGRIIFYVATVSRFVEDVAKNNKMAVTLTQDQTESGCNLFDAEWPMCARASILGKAEKVPESQADEAAELLFARHPQMKGWAQLKHKWQFYELHVENAFILDWFGGYHTVSRDEYFAAKPSEPA